MRNSPEEIHTHTTESKQLAYTQEFKDWIKVHPNAIRLFNELSTYIKQTPVFSNDPIEFKDVKATVKKDYSWGNNRFIYLKITMDGQSFFVKSEGIPSRGKGFTEFMNSHEVREKLNGLKARVINYQLGYEDTDGRSYFVSKWDNNITKILDIKVILRGKIYDAEKTQEGHSKADEITRRLNDLQERVNGIKALLPEYHDLSDSNIFYDQKTDEIVLLDLFKEPQNIY